MSKEIDRTDVLNMQSQKSQRTGENGSIRREPYEYLKKGMQKKKKKANEKVLRKKAWHMQRICVNVKELIQMSKCVCVCVCVWWKEIRIGEVGKHVGCWITW